jgi:hypothetical protein
MEKTSLSVVTAIVLVVLSVALLISRWYVLGLEIDGLPGTSTWKVTLKVEGHLTAKDASLTIVLPPSFRRQLIADETFASQGLTHRVRRSTEIRSRKVEWKRRPSVGQDQPFRAVYSFRCVLGMRRPTAGMMRRTHILDAAPREGRATRPTPQIESDHEQIGRRADQLTPRHAELEDQIRSLFDYVAGLASEEPAAGPTTALECLRRGKGDAGGKSRLLVALCRNRGIPARLLCGLILEGEGTQNVHYWAEAWVEERWLPMCPSRHRFGSRRIPDTYLVLQIGDGDLIRGEGAHFQYGFVAEDLHNAVGLEGNPPPSLAKTLWRKASLTNLKPDEQEWVKFLLLLPLAALIVCVFRTMIGIATFGTFGPALLGLVCRDPKDLPWGLAVFVAIMVVGWGSRCVLDYFHLLLVPRISVVLTIIVLVLIAGVMVASNYGLTMKSFVSLLPLIILTHMVERFWTVETEDGTAASFKTLLGTVAVAVAINLAINLDVVANGAARVLGLGSVLSPGVVRNTLFRYPETLGLVLAAQFLVGRYTGYRLTELFRFRDLITEVQLPGGGNEPVRTLPPPAGFGHPGHERAQHPVHPGPQPAPALSPGGREAANA